MSQITPFTYVAVQNVEVQRQGTIDKERQLRKAATQEKDIAAQDDALEHQVERTEEVQALGDEPEHEKQRRKRARTAGHDDEDDDGDGNTHIDLTA